MEASEVTMAVRSSGGEARKRPRPASSSRGRVLIVDDIPDNRRLLALFCDQFGLAHEAVESGREAVAAVGSDRFDVVLMDIFMPGMDGMTAARMIRSLPGPSAAIPIIAVTTAAGSGEVQRYLACGINDVVAKPILAARLMQALEAALAEVRRAARATRRRAAQAA